MGLFQISPEVGQGLCLWLPKGARVRVLLEDFLRPGIAAARDTNRFSVRIWGAFELYETSGHFPYYRDSQFPPLFVEQAGGLVGRLDRPFAERRRSVRGS